MAAELETVENSERSSEELPRSGKKKNGDNNFMGMDVKNLAIIVVAAIAIGFIVYQIFLAPKYTLLYSDLNQSDAAAISSYLEKNNIKFKISNDGTGINVAGVSVPKLRLELANKEMPRGSGVGFEIFDKTNINISDFNQKINYKRALEGELSRTISSLESIKSAKVHLVLANKSLFKNTIEESKASVVIITEFNSQLSDKQIKSIQHLVSSAVQDLKPENVQITDQAGNSLVNFNDENSLKEEKLSLNESKVKDFESKLEKNLIDLLDPILGKGNVLVNVVAEMNFDEAEVNIEMFNPVDGTGNKTEPVIRSEKVVSEKYNKKVQRIFGTGGSQNNLPNFINSKRINPAGDDDKDYSKEDKTMNYEISKSIERIKKASGLVKKISVAVVVNKDINASERATLKQTVQVAAGLNVERGDQVIVTGIKFSSTPYTDLIQQKEQKEMKKMDRDGRLKKVVSLLLVTFGGIIIVLIILISLNAGVENTKTDEIDSLLQEENIPILSSIDQKLQEAEEAYHRQLSLEGDRTVESMKNQISQMALRDPKTIARALAAYIND